MLLTDEAAARLLAAGEAAVAPVPPNSSCRFVGDTLSEFSLVDWCLPAYRHDRYSALQ
jgi:hypothetical protein